MAKFVNSSPLEENENQFIWHNIYYTEFKKTLTNIFDRFYDNSITGDLDSDTESKSGQKRIGILSRIKAEHE